jgi:hypothetical protein
VAGWAGQPAGPRAQGVQLGQKGEEREGREKKRFSLFLISIFYMNAFTFSTIKNAWFGMVQQIKEINSRVYHYHMT